ncbi:MAG: 3D domain-containing protein [Chthoniobacterales bacterium]
MKYLPLLLAILLPACASRPSKPCPAPTAAIAGKHRVIRTTAYSHQEDGNRRNALNKRLSCGQTYSASADWSRYPAGTVFRLAENGRTYLVDDYGSALVGTDTIDLYVPSLREMNRWGVRQVHIEVLQMGSFSESLATLRPRAKRGYVRRMVRDLESKVL